MTKNFNRNFITLVQNTYINVLGISMVFVPHLLLYCGVC